MAQDAIRKQMDEAWAMAREELLGVMEKAPADNIISGTEWEVRAIQQGLAQRCFQLMVQSKVDRLDQSPTGVFSPGQAGAARGAPAQGGLPARLPHHQR
jgi:hypothetical protein